MITEHRLLQASNDVVDVSGWESDSEFPIGPQGAKPKKILICPTPTPHPFLISGHRYLFKQPEGSRIQQIWSEILAYELGRDLNLSIPPAFAAINSRDGSVGVLIEFFYGFQDEAHEVRFVDGRAIFSSQRQSFNERTGSLRQNYFLSRGIGVTNALEWWAKTIIFDALIGNTDRHSENWGFLIKFNEAGTHSRDMAPVFDNGTSLGQIVREEELPDYLLPGNGGRFAKFIRKGQHHFSWLPGGVERGHVALCEHFATLHFTARPFMHSVIQLDDNRIEEVLTWAKGFDFPVRVTDLRSDFLKRQLVTRRDLLREAIGG